MFPTENGDYQVMVIDSFGCYSLSTPYNVLDVGIKNLNTNFSLEVFPNPFYDECVVKWNSSIGDVELTIVNSQGQKVIQRNMHNVSETTINRDDLSRGIYLLFFGDANHSFLITRKLILE
jgi:hypothetical protein